MREKSENCVMNTIRPYRYCTKVGRAFTPWRAYRLVAITGNINACYFANKTNSVYYVYAVQEHL